ncbi:MAG: molybdopterin-dependent oxidoreductase [Candidatus Limnocylindrales bacterium]
MAVPADASRLRPSGEPSASPPAAAHASVGSGLLAGLLAAGPALLILVAAHTLTGSPGFLEALADGLTFLPLQLVGAAIATFGPLAKGLVYLGIGLGFLALGAIVGAVLDRRLPRPGDSGLALAIALGLFAVAEVVVLPLFQEGFLGNATGFDPIALHAPLALACLAYGAAFLALRGPAGASAARSPARARDGGPAGGSAMPRRTFLGRSLGLVGGLSVLAAFGTMGSQVITAARSRTGGRLAAFPADSFGPTPALTPVDDFYIVAKDLITPTVAADSWRLLIDGLVERPTSVSLAQLQAMPALEAYRTLECISTEIVAGDHLIGNQRWKGVRIADLLAPTGVQPAATAILWEAADGYTESIPLQVALDPDSWIAYEMGDAPLPPEHGAPARVLIAGRFGMKQPKWVTRMHLAATVPQGYWEERGWDEQAVVRTMSRIDFPLPGDTVPVGGAFRAYGIANAGDRGVSAVQISADGGMTWQAAQLADVHAAPFGPLSWILWRADLTLAAAGPARLVVRAVDGSGAIQSGEETSALPSGSTGWHAVRVLAAPGA